MFAALANSQNLDHPVKPHNLIRTFAVHRYILQYPIILQADSEGPDQTAHIVQSDLGLRCPHLPQIYILTWPGSHILGTKIKEGLLFSLMLIF